jgi:carbon-monoxide dehydrogenase large subunit
MGEYGLGQAVPRSEDPRLLRGGGRYTDDLALPRMAYGFILRSPHAHARIRHLDTTRAEDAPGVQLVLTGTDWQQSGWRDIPAGGDLKRPDGSPMYTPPNPALVTDRVRRVGDYVAMVVADSVAQAMDAAELIEVDYEPLPAIIDTEAAAQEGAVSVWDECSDNLCFLREIGNRDAVAAAFAAADHVVRQKLVITRVACNPIEPRACVGSHDVADGHFTIYTTLQGAHPFRAQLARLMKIPEGKLRVVAGDVGGSFGMKSAVFNEAPLVLLAAQKLGRPVKWTSSRAEAFVSDSQGRDNVIEAELALDRDGKFLGLRLQSIANLGAYIMQGTINPPVNNIGSVAGVYTTPVIHVSIKGVFTHTVTTRPYRGAGRPEAAYVIERLVDLAADTLRIDPAELRRRNTIPPDALPFKTGLTYTYDSGEFEKNLTMALDLADYEGFARRRADARNRGRLRGIGISNTIERAGSPGIEAAEIRFDRSGTATIFAGSVTAGQGHETVFKQVASSVLGLEPGDMSYISGDTDKVPFGHGSGGSRSSSLGGSAVHIAATRIADKAKIIAAHMMEAPLEEIDFTDGLFSRRGSNRSLTIKEVAKAAINPKNLPNGIEPGLMASVVYTGKQASYPNGCHICELEIDEETGTVDVTNYSVVDDVGTVMNPLLLEGQIQGGIVQGLGQILMEDLRFDAESGQLLTGSFMDYAMPRAGDVCMMQVRCNPVPTKGNPLGIKGAGEAGTVGSMPAVANAVVDALSVYGIHHLDMPATPEKLWRAIAEAKARQGVTS